jgi:hypothetical protein
MSAKPTPLDSGYTAEFDTVTEKQWEEILKAFQDANIYQTWPYDAVRCGEKNLGHLVLRFDGQVVSVAQVRLVRIPGLEWVRRIFAGVPSGRVGTSNRSLLFSDWHCVHSKMSMSAGEV